MELQEVLRINKEKGRLQRYNTLHAQRKRMKKEAVKEKILATIVGIFITTITCLLLISLSNMNKKNIKRCMEQGYTENYCIAHL